MKPCKRDGYDDDGDGRGDGDDPCTPGSQVLQDVWAATEC